MTLLYDGSNPSLPANFPEVQGGGAKECRSKVSVDLVDNKRMSQDYRKHSTPLKEVSHAVKKVLMLVGATKPIRV